MSGPMIDIRLEMPYQNIFRHRDTDFSRAENSSGKQTEKSENTHTVIPNPASKFPEWL